MCGIGTYISRKMYVYKSKKSVSVCAVSIYWCRVVYLILCKRACSETLGDLCEQEEEDVVYIRALL